MLISSSLSEEEVEQVDEYLLTGHPITLSKNIYVGLHVVSQTYLMNIKRGYP